MKTWTDLSKVNTPARIQALEKDVRGYPIPHGVTWVDGVPDFRVIDDKKWMEAVQNRLCGLCGCALDKNVAFVGGKMSMKNRMFTDAPMHVDCAIYALQVCPFLAMRKFGYIDREEDAGLVNPHVSTNRPEVFGMGVTTKFKPVQLGDTVAIKAGMFSRIVLWRQGVQVPTWDVGE
jgi:hypothetical protein